MDVNNALIRQLDEIRGEFDQLRSRSKYDDVSDQPERDAVRLLTRARAAILRIAGSSSAYGRQCEEIVNQNTYTGHKVWQLIGVVDSLRSDLESGFLESLSELIHGELFGDFLEMAQHLVDEGYKDAAAVVAGSALEAHLRQLSHRAGISIEVIDAKGVRPKKAEALNAELSRNEVYSKLDQKNVTSWLDLRNHAAHGRYGEYNQEQVKLLIASIRDFLTRNPA